MRLIYRGISYQPSLNSPSPNHPTPRGFTVAKYRGVSYLVTRSQQKLNPLENHSGKLIAKYRGVTYATSVSG